MAVLATSRDSQPDMSAEIDRVLLQLDRFNRAAEAHRIWTKKAIECVEFHEGKQWSDTDKRALEDEGRPALVFNQISPLVRLVLGYERQNRYDLRYLPGNDALSSMEKGEVLSKVAKQVMEDNKAEWKISSMFRDGIQAGRGYIDMRIDFDDNEFGEITVNELDPFTVYVDPEAQSYEPEKWNYVFISRWLSINEVFLMYGPRAARRVEPYNIVGTTNPTYPIIGDLEDDEKPETMFGLFRFGTDGQDSDTFRLGSRTYGLFDHLDRWRKTIRVIEQQHYVLSSVNYFVDLKTGKKKAIPDTLGADKIREVMAWAELKGEPLGLQRRVARRLRHTVTAGDQVLYDDWSPYTTPTVIPYFAYFRRGKTMGMIEDLIDPQKEINKRRSAEIHIVGTTAHSGWMYHEDALDPDEEVNLRVNGATPGVNIKWKGTQKPEKIQPGVPPTAMEKLEIKAQQDLFKITGINESAMGQIDRVQSGRAIEARQRQAVLAIEVYMDNMRYTRHLIGEKVLELVQNFYTEPRLFRILGDDGIPEELLVNTPANENVADVINDITIGEYTVAIDEAPASATFLQAQFEEALELRDKGVLIPDEILIDLSTMPRKREIKAALAEAKAKAAMGLGGPPAGGATPVGGPGGPSGPPAAGPAQKKAA